MSASTAVLVAGYAMAVPFTLYPPGFQRLWKRRELWVLGVEETGAALIAAGWFAKGNTSAAVFNAAWCVGLGVAWVVKGRRSA